MLLILLGRAQSQPSFCSRKHYLSWQHTPVTGTPVPGNKFRSMGATWMLRPGGKDLVLTYLLELGLMQTNMSAKTLQQTTVGCNAHGDQSRFHAVSHKTCSLFLPSLSLSPSASLCNWPGADQHECKSTAKQGKRIKLRSFKKQGVLYHFLSATKDVRFLICVHPS